MRRLAIGVLSAILLSGNQAPVASATQTDRLEGANRYGTAVSVSESAWTSANTDVIYLARGDVLADALAAGVLRGAEVVKVVETTVVGQRPVKLTHYRDHWELCGWFFCGLSLVGLVDPCCFGQGEDFRGDAGVEAFGVECAGGGQDLRAVFGLGGCQAVVDVGRGV